MTTRPFVDIGVYALEEDGQPLIVTIVSGYRPLSFASNWARLAGPFIYFLRHLSLHGIRLTQPGVDPLLAYEIVSVSTDC
jgi:hypothetical protein